MLLAIVLALIASATSLGVAGLNLVGSARSKPVVNERIATLEAKVDDLTNRLGMSEVRADQAQIKLDECRSREQGLWVHIRELEAKLA